MEFRQTNWNKISEKEEKEKKKKEKGVTKQHY